MRFYHSVLGGTLSIDMAEAVLGEDCPERGLVFTSELVLGKWRLDASDAMTPEIAAKPRNPGFITVPTRDRNRWSDLVTRLHGGEIPVKVTRLMGDSHVELVAELGGTATGRARLSAHGGRSARSERMGDVAARSHSQLGRTSLRVPPPAFVAVSRMKN